MVRQKASMTCDVHVRNHIMWQVLIFGPLRLFKRDWFQRRGMCQMPVQ
jgi:hypothetical protein